MFVILSKAAVHSPRILHCLRNEPNWQEAANRGFESLLIQRLGERADFDEFSHEHLQLCVDTLHPMILHKSAMSNLNAAINAPQEIERAKARIRMFPQREHDIISSCSPETALSLVQQRNVSLLRLLMRCMERDAVDVFRTLLSCWKPDRDVKTVLLHRARSLENNIFVNILEQ
jgi:hypothetical protein